MKIDKTEREARERFYREYESNRYADGLRGEGLRAFLGGVGGGPPEAAAAMRLMAAQEDYRAPIWRAVKAALGLEFKEEEPELPKRLSIGPGGSIVDAPRPGVLASSKIHREAAARYNAWERIMQEPTGFGSLQTEGLRGVLQVILHEERERLQ